jgi:hypothetical protein
MVAKEEENIHSGYFNNNTTLQKKLKKSLAHYHFKALS